MLDSGKPIAAATRLGDVTRTLQPHPKPAHVGSAYRALVFKQYYMKLIANPHFPCKEQNSNTLFAYVFSSIGSIAGTEPCV